MSRHLDALTQLVHDVHSLRAKGWIRGFFDEEECGRSVGSSKGQLGGSSPLTAAEQRVVLTKLGGGGGGGGFAAAVPNVKSKDLVRKDEDKNAVIPTPAMVLPMPFGNK